MNHKFCIRGRQVTLRATNLSDISQYKRWNNKDLKAWQLDTPWNDSNLSAIINWRRTWIYDGGKPPYRFLEIEAYDKRHIGWVVVYHDNKDPHMTEIGIDIPEEAYWGRGIGEEALTLWIEYLFDSLNLSRIGLSTWSGNLGMMRLAEKLGFALEGTIRCGCRVDKTFYDRLKYGILKAEWDGRE